MKQFDINNTREKYHVLIRKTMVQTQVLKNRSKMIANLTNHNIGHILSSFPQSIAQLEAYINYHTSQSETIKKILSDSFQELYKKVNMRNIETFERWSDIMRFFLNSKVKTQQIFWNQYFSQYLQQAQQLGQYDTLFCLMTQIDLAKMPATKHDQLIQIIQQALRSYLPETFQKSKSQKSNTQIQVSNQNLIALLFAIIRMRRVPFFDPKNSLFENFLSQNTMQILLHILFSGSKLMNIRIGILHVLINLFSIDDLEQKYWGYFIQNNTLHNLKCIIEFASPQEKINSWRLIYNIFHCEKYRPLIIKNNYHLLAADCIIYDNQTNSQVKKVMQQVRSFYILYFYSLEFDVQFLQFYQCNGMRVLSILLNRYQLLDETQLKLLLTNLKQMLEFSVKNKNVSISPLVIAAHTYSIHSSLRNIVNQTTTQISQLADDCLEIILDQLNQKVYS